MLYRYRTAFKRSSEGEKYSRGDSSRSANGNDERTKSQVLIVYAYFAPLGHNCRAGGFADCDQSIWSRGRYYLEVYGSRQREPRERYFMHR
jgi:hypothetical protein